MTKPPLPSILVVDDFFGRAIAGEDNSDRMNLCRRLRLVDVTGDQESGSGFSDPIAEAVFHRGQAPVCARVGDVVRNDPETVIDLLLRGAGKGRPWSMVLLDLCFYTGRVTAQSEAERGPGMPVGCGSDQDHYFGLELLSRLSEVCPGVPFVILSSMERSTAAEHIVPDRALGFIGRGLEDPASYLIDFLVHHGLIHDREGLIVGRSDALLIALRAARRAAVHDRPVLIRGERGTGKDLFASYIHRHRNPDRPFKTLNCGQFSGGDPLAAMSTFVGHRKGAFTGAVHSRLGAVLEARNGVLFLDEIANLSMEAQAGLHRLVQNKEVAQLGAQENPVRDVQVKLIAASNADLEGLALREPPAFMADLLDRLKLGDTIVLPPLRDRLEDLPTLVETFVRKAEGSGEPLMFRGRTIDPAVYDVLRSYDWPGNVRELEGCIMKAVSTYKHMEKFTPQAIELPKTSVAPHRPTPATRGDRELSVSQRHAIEMLKHVDFSTSQRNELRGQLNVVLSVLGSYLEAVVRATTTPSAEDADGEINLQAAARWATGNDKLKGRSPADLFNRLLNPLARDQRLPPVLAKVEERVNKALKKKGEQERS